MKTVDQKVLDALYRSNFQSFVHRSYRTLHPGGQFLPNWHIEAIAHHLDLVRRGKIKRLIINLPPRHLKSITVSVAWPAYLLGLEPWRRIFVISYGSELSAKHSNDFRSVVESNWYRRAFPAMRIRRSLEDEVTTIARGFRRSTSITGTLTGLGAGIIIIDDPQKPADAYSEPLRNRVNQWVSRTLMSRLDSKETGAIVIVMQRLHLHDLAGFLTTSSNDWTVLNLAAIAEKDEKIAIGDGRFYHRSAGEALHPEHESLETLLKQERSLGPDIWSAQYQQRPVAEGGNFILRKWLRYYDFVPRRRYSTTIIQSWDTAAKDGMQNDYSACTTVMLKDDIYYVLNVSRGRYNYPDLFANALSLAKRFEPDVILIEDASTGIALAQQLKDEHMYAVETIPVNRNKKERVFVQQGKFAAARVLFPKDAAFMSELLSEMLTFPQSRYDDQIDSLCQALAYEPSGYDETQRWVRGDEDDDDDDDDGDDSDEDLPYLDFV